MCVLICAGGLVEAGDQVDQFAKGRERVHDHPVALRDRSLRFPCKAIGLKRCLGHFLVERAQRLGGALQHLEQLGLDCRLPRGRRYLAGDLAAFKRDSPAEIPDFPQIGRCDARLLQ